MIVGVAVRNDKLTIMLPAPARHSDCFEYAMSQGIDLSVSKIGYKSGDQGFYTHTGKYLDRVQAGKYARRIGQATDKYDGIPNKGALMSEDLW